MTTADAIEMRLLNEMFTKYAEQVSEIEKLKEVIKSRESRMEELCIQMLAVAGEDKRLNNFLDLDQMLTYAFTRLMMGIHMLKAEIKYRDDKSNDSK